MASNPNSKPLSISLSSSKNAKKPSSASQSTKSLNRGTESSLPHRSTARRTNHFQDHDSDEDDDAAKVPIHEEVTAFDRDAGGAIGADGGGDRGKKKELVIKVDSTNNWRDRGRRKGGKNLLPKEVQAQREGEANKSGVVVEREGPSMEFGLSFAKRQAMEEEEKREERSEDVNMVDAEPAEPRKPLTEDEIAMQSLVRESNGEGGERRSDLVIGGANAQQQEDDDDRPDEMTSFREDVASRPDMASMDQYAAVPVEEFGAALLRGMGWKEGQPVGRGKYGASDAANTNGAKPRVPERRPGYLGIGAKDIAGKKGAEGEIGAWGKAAMRKSKKDGGSSGEGLYTPVLMKQKNTGALITEDEFKALGKEGGGGSSEGKKEDDWKERRDRNLENNGRDRRRDYDDDDNDDYDRSKRGSSRRDRSRSSDDKDRESRRRRRREESGGDTESDRGKDDRYYRDRERYRDRGGDSDRKHRDSRRHRDDYDSRHSSSSHSSRRDRRDRDSDRESHRKRDRYGDEDRKRSSRREEVY